MNRFFAGDVEVSAIKARVLTALFKDFVVDVRCPTRLLGLHPFDGKALLFKELTKDSPIEVSANDTVHINIFGSEGFKV